MTWPPPARTPTLRSRIPRNGCRRSGDRAALPPTRSSRVAPDLRQDEGGASRARHPLELAIGEERDRPAVGRESGLRRSLGAGNAAELQARERALVDESRVALPREEGEGLAVGGE